ncbi:hypothetical protein [Kitasatospora purpeofusca]|uniref:hypothetical protein n=1 Tax=Kitasatospora purpeofusca TaxID=67352 RepID=UPI0035DE449D
MERSEDVEGGVGVGGEGVEGGSEGVGVVGAGGGGDDVRAESAVPADAELGEPGVESVLEGGVGGGGAVDGEELLGLGIVGAVEEPVGEAGVGFEDAADVALRETVGLQRTPRRSARSSRWVEGGEPGGDGVTAVAGLVHEGRKAKPQQVGPVALGGAGEVGGGERGLQGVRGQGKAAGAGGGLPVAALVAEESVLNVLRVGVLVVFGAVRGFGVRGVEEVGEGGHMEGERVTVGTVPGQLPGHLQGCGGRVPVVAGQAGDCRERESEGVGRVTVVTGTQVGVVSGE